MKTFGQTLKSAREKQHLTHAFLHKKLHIPVQVLEALEQENADKLPAQPLVRGYVQLLARELQLPEEALLALWRRDFAPANKVSNPPVGSRRRNHWNIRRFSSPRTVSFALLLMAALTAGTYVFFQWQRLSKPPELTLSSPENLSVVAAPVRVSGRTHPNNTVVINTQPISLDQQGRFEYQLELPPGERAIVVSAKDNRGRESEQILFVTVSP